MCEMRNRMNQMSKSRWKDRFHETTRPGMKVRRVVVRASHPSSAAEKAARRCETTAPSGWVMSRTNSTDNGRAVKEAGCSGGSRRDKRTRQSDHSALNGVEPVESQLDAGYPELIERLQRIEAALSDLANRKLEKEWYTTAEIAEQLGKAEFTVREWCRLGRIHAEKRPYGRGCSQEWMVSHEEVRRIRNEGLLPDAHRYHHSR